MFNSYSYEILYEQFHWIYLQGDIKLLLVTVNNRLKFEIKIVHDLSCHPILLLHVHCCICMSGFCGSQHRCEHPLVTLTTWSTCWSIALTSVCATTQPISSTSPMLSMKFSPMIVRRRTSAIPSLTISLSLSNTDISLRTSFIILGQGLYLH